MQHYMKYQETSMVMRGIFCTSWSLNIHTKGPNSSHMKSSSHHRSRLLSQRWASYEIKWVNTHQLCWVGNNKSRCQRQDCLHSSWIDRSEIPIQHSGSGCVACVQEIVSGGWTRLLHCNLEIGAHYSLATNSGVKLAIPKNNMLPVSSGSKGIGMPDARRQCQAVCADHGELSWSKPRNNAWPMMTCVSTSGWLPLYVLPYTRSWSMTFVN